MALWNRIWRRDGPALSRGARAALCLGILLGAGSASSQSFSVQEKSDLEFGLIAVGGSSGPVSVGPTGIIDCGVHTCLGGQRPARFKIRASGSATYDLSYSTGDVLVHVGGGPSLSLQNLSDNYGGTLPTNPGGNVQFKVGGELVVGTSAASGMYTGNFTIFFNLE